MALEYNEQVETLSPSAAGFSLSQQKSVRTYLLTPSSPQDLIDSITDLLGTTTVGAPNAGSGRVQRSMPKADPLFPWLYAHNISQFKVVGRPAQTNAQGALELTPLSSFAYYPTYWVTVEFLPRPYAVLPDDQVGKFLRGYYPPTDDGAAAALTYNYVAEWQRYTTFTLQPQFEAVNATVGTSIYRSGSGPPSGPNGTPYPWKWVQRLPNQYLRVMWYGVPLRYLYSTRSYLAYPGWLFRVNQDAWATPVRTFPAGSLLYLGANPGIPYTPPVRQMVAGAEGVNTTARLCDVELTFLYTDRVAGDPPAAPTNRNFVVNGHNAQPSLPYGGFFYASVNTATVARQYPSYFSFPVHLLFMDPDIQPNGTLAP